MSKEGVIYASGVERRDEMIIRRFCAKNDITFSQFMKIVSHVIAGYGTMRMFDGKVKDFDPQFERFDMIVRDYMEKNTPDAYRRIPLLQRMFGRVYKPLTKKEIDEIDALLAQNPTILEEETPEAPDVEAKELE